MHSKKIYPKQWQLFLYPNNIINFYLRKIEIIKEAYFARDKQQL